MVATAGLPLCPPHSGPGGLLLRCAPPHVLAPLLGPGHLQSGAEERHLALQGTPTRGRKPAAQEVLLASPSPLLLSASPGLKQQIMGYVLSLSLGGALGDKEARARPAPHAQGQHLAFLLQGCTQVGPFPLVTSVSCGASQKRAWLSLVSVPHPTVVKGKGPFLWASAARQDHSGMNKVTSRTEEAQRLPVGSAGTRAHSLDPVGGGSGSQCPPTPCSCKPGQGPPPSKSSQSNEL